MVQRLVELGTFVVLPRLHLAVDRHDLPTVRFAIQIDCRELRVETEPTLTLLCGRNPDVTNDLHRVPFVDGVIVTNPHRTSRVCYDFPSALFGSGFEEKHDGSRAPGGVTLRPHSSN